MKAIQIFVASSLEEFAQERLELGVCFDKFEQAMQVDIQWNRPETSLHEMRPEGSQDEYDRKIREADFVFLLVGKHMGQYTEHEFDLAWEQRSRTGRPHIRPYFLLKGGVFPDRSVLDFQEKLRKMQYFTDAHSSLSEISQDIFMLLADWIKKNPCADGAAVGPGADEGVDAESQEFLAFLRELEAGPLAYYTEIKLIGRKGRQLTEELSSSGSIPARRILRRRFALDLEQTIHILDQDTGCPEYAERREALEKLKDLL